jgi:CRP/FNR family transcriptional regulator
MPVTSLRDAAMCDNRLPEAMYRQMSQEIVHEHERMVLLGSVGAMGRLAAFLFEVSDRMRMRGYSPVEFNIRMSRADIGSYLCLRLETVSRAFSTLQEQGVLDVDKRHIVIRSLAKLRRLQDRDTA